MAGIDDLLGRKAPDFLSKNLGIKGLKTMRRSALLEQAWRYWTAQREGADLPRRAALDPKEMGPLLGHAMVLDRVQPGAVRVRLGGHVMNALMGMEVRGLHIRAFFDPADRPQVLQKIEQVFEGPSTLELDLISETEDGLLTARMLILPLLDGADRVTKALAVTVTDRVPSDPPRRFQLTNATLVPVAGAPTRQADLPRRRLFDHHLPVELQAGMAEEAAPFDAKKPARVPWLRVIK